MPTDGTRLPIDRSGDFGASPFCRQLSGKQTLDRARKLHGYRINAYVRLDQTNRIETRLSVQTRHRRIMRAGSGLQPLRMTTLDPIQHPGAPRPQQRHIIREQCQTERKHPDAEDRQERQDASEDQQQSRWDSEPAPGWLAEGSARRHEDASAAARLTRPGANHRSDFDGSKLQAVSEVFQGKARCGPDSACGSS